MNKAERRYKRGFWMLMATQAQGAFNDNVFKMVIVYLLVSATRNDAGVYDEREYDSILSTATFLFSIPFVIFPGIFGAISDKFSKKRVIVMTKYIEVFVMALGVIAFKMGAPPFLWILLFAMATQSAFFGPGKYGILPEILPEQRLSWGNGILQMGTMVAIIAGVGLAGPLYKYLQEDVYLIGIFLMLFSCVGMVTSHNVTRPAPADPSLQISWNPWKGMGKHLRHFWHDRWMGVLMAGYCYFWFIGVLLQTNVTKYAQVTLGLEQDFTSYMLASVAIGIGAGAVSAGYLSRNRVEIGLVPLGCVGMMIFGCLLGWPGLTYGPASVLLLGLAFFCGTMEVPLAASIQQRAPQASRGGIMATSNMLTFLSMSFAGLVYWVLTVQLKLAPNQMFLVCGLLTLGIGGIMILLLPVIAVRFVLWCLASTFYRVRTVGRSNIPDAGGALIAANHSSFFDAFLLTAAIDRPIRFVLEGDLLRKMPGARTLARALGAILYDRGSGPRERAQAIGRAREALGAGELVCLLTPDTWAADSESAPQTGSIERLCRGVQVPIIPVYLDRVWLNLANFREGRFYWKRPSSVPYVITVSAGAPLHANASAREIRDAVEEIEAELYRSHADKADLLHRAFAKKARRMPRMLAMADFKTPGISYIRALAGSLLMARRLHARLDKAPMVGVLLPPSVGGALANVSLQLMGRVAVNLNYTTSAETIASCARQCNLTQVITSRAFLEKVPLTVPGEALYLEEVMEGIGKVERLFALLKALCWPVRSLERAVGSPGDRSADDIATIVFSSGSEGEPKGVVLSHRNILCNAEASVRIFPHDKGDVIMGILPFFHSFGFMATLWLPLLSELSVVYHPNPLEARAIGDMIQEYKASIFIATSTFLQNFIRRCTPEQMESLKFVVCGAEKLSARVRDAFSEKFGIEPLEGYGTTECAPAVSLNVPDIRMPGFHHVGNKRGSIGRAIPGVQVQIVEPETWTPLAKEEPGVLVVKGPNLMQGYLNKPEKTAEVMRDGWYLTGDIATIDEEGFITITDRMSRFSKLGGEMVPHTRVEEAMHELLGLTDQRMVVASVPDELKGERLVVLHTLEDEQYEALVDKLRDCDLPNLWIPRSSGFYKVDAIPVLGTGKLDLRKVKELAQKLDIGE